MVMHGRMFPVGRNSDYDRGLRLFDQGLYELAIPELEKVVALPGEDTSILVKLASFYLAECWSFLGSYALGQRLFERSAVCFEEALKRNPGYADLHSKLSAVYFLQDRIEDANREIELALTINPQYARALVQSGLIKYRLGQPEEGIQLIQQAVDIDKTLPVEHFIQGVAAHTVGDYSAASNFFSLLIESDVDEIAYHARLGSDFFRRGMLNEASEAFEKALQLNPDYADLHNSLGMTYHSAGKFELAMAEFQKAIAINPKYEEAHFNHALSLAAATDAGISATVLRLVVDNSDEDTIKSS